VIKVRHTQNSRVEIGGIAAQNVQIIIYNWYAKNVGLIKTQVQGQQTGTNVLNNINIVYTALKFAFTIYKSRVSGSFFDRYFNERFI
jgi:hypothetical protein